MRHASCASDTHHVHASCGSAFLKHFSESVSENLCWLGPATSKRMWMKNLELMWIALRNAPDTCIAESMQTRIVILHRLTEGMSSTFDQENQGNLHSDLSWRDSLRDVSIIRKSLLTISNQGRILYNYLWYFEINIWNGVGHVPSFIFKDP